MRGRLLFCLAICILSLVLARDSFGWTPPDLDERGTFGPWADGEDANIFWSAGHETLYLVPTVPPIEGAGWIIPIPAKGCDVSVRWHKTSPFFEGRTSQSYLHMRLDGGLAFAWATQVYPIFWLALTPQLGRSEDAVARPEADPRGGLEFSIPDIRSRDELDHEITGAGIKLAAADRITLASLVNGQHTLIFLHPSTLAAYRGALGLPAVPPDDTLHNPEAMGFPPQSSPCLEIDFPTAKPLVPEYFRGGDGLMLGANVIAVAGDVVWTAPPATASPSPGPTFRLCRGSLCHFADETHAVADRDDVPYTRVVYEGPQAQMTFDPLLPLAALSADHFCAILTAPEVFWPLVIGWTALGSYLAGGLAGTIVTRRWRPFARTGLWNLGSILALWFQLARKQEHASRFRDFSIRLFLFVFTLCFSGLNFAVSCALTVWLGQWHS